MAKNIAGLKLEIKSVNDSLDNLRHEVSVTDALTAKKLDALEAEIMKCKNDLESHNVPVELTNRLESVERSLGEIKASSVIPSNSKIIVIANYCC